MMTMFICRCDLFLFVVMIVLIVMQIYVAFVH